MKKYPGFTLIEILIAVAIIAILTAIGIVSYSSVNKRSRDAKRFGDIEQIRSALEMYRSDRGHYPAPDGNQSPSFGVAANLQTELVDNGYLPSIPADPQSPTHNYMYEASNQDLETGNFYGYCLCGFIENNSQVTSTCTPDASCTYAVRNP